MNCTSSEATRTGEQFRTGSRRSGRSPRCLATVYELQIAGHFFYAGYRLGDAPGFTKIIGVRNYSGEVNNTSIGRNIDVFLVDTQIAQECHFYPGILRCLDLDEQSPLPTELSSGSKTYDEFK